MVKEKKSQRKNMLSSLQLEKQSTSELLVQNLLKKIKSGELENGYKLPPQRELAQLFNVGMSTVREALKVLNVMGYIDPIHGSGTFVVNPPVGRNEEMDIDQALKLISLSDVMQGRLVIECAIVETSAVVATQKDIEEIESWVMKMEKTIGGDIEAFYDADLLGFHVSVAKASHNQTLVEVARKLNRRVRNEYTLLMQNELDNVTEDNIKAAVKSARVVCQRIKSRDPKGASFALRSHLSIVSEHERLEKTSRSFNDESH